MSDRKRSLSLDAYNQIEELIVTQQLKPGQLLSEAELSGQLGLGRTPIREALQRLNWDGLVVIMPRRGVLVSEIDYGKQMLVLEVRREVERLMAAKASLRATQEERNEFLLIAENMEEAAKVNDGITFIRYDGRLNILLAEACHNEYAMRMSRIWNGLSRRFWYLHYQRAADLPLIAKLHAELARAITEGDPKQAGKASDTLNDYVLEFTKSAFNLP